MKSLSALDLLWRWQVSKLIVKNIKPQSKNASSIGIESDTSLVSPGQILQVVTKRVDTDSTYSYTATGDGTLITPLTTSIYPVKSDSIILVKFNVFGEVNQDSVFLVHGARQTYNPAVPGGETNVKTFNISPAVDGKTTWDLEVEGSLNLSTYGTWTLTPTNNFSTVTKIWGGGGGVPTYAASNYGGAGGAAAGTISFTSGTSYDLIVGQGGAGVAANRNAGGAGAGSGIQFTTGSVPILVAGGGGGGYSSAGRRAGAGGGSEGQAGDGAAGGLGGTQSGPGIGRSGGRRTGASGSGRNGGQLGTGTAATRTSTGFGTGGAGAYNGGDAGSGGGGSGYYGGAEGGGDSGGFGGGGGSGYYNPTYVSSATLYQGNYEIPGNSSDADRGTAGSPGVGIVGSFDGTDGKILIKGDAQAAYWSSNALTLISDTGYEGKNTLSSSTWVGYTSANYDNDTNSTPNNYFIQYYIPVNGSGKLDIGLAIRGSNSTGIFALNRAYTINVGTNYEFGVSTVTIMEIAQ